ncbi:MAG TPA: hypothetical protein VEG36_07730 [Burkholderiales bacterium]|nr:hypothetical protein [Burkholderiales bacterium]
MTLIGWAFAERREDITSASELPTSPVLDWIGEARGRGSVDPGAVFAKTDKGREEISRRSFGLPPRLRALLVMIDGQTSASEHRDKCKGLGDVPGMLATLSAQGFIFEKRESKDAA